MKQYLGAEYYRKLTTVWYKIITRQYAVQIINVALHIDKTINLC